MSEIILKAVGSYEDLLIDLHSLALKYRDTFQGVAIQAAEGGGVQVFYDDEQGKAQSVIYEIPNDNNAFNWVKRLEHDGFFDENNINHEAIIDFFEQLGQQTKAEQERRKQELAAKFHNRFRFGIEMTVVLVGAVMASVISWWLTVRYTPNPSEERVQALEVRLDKIEALRPRTNPPATQPKPYARQTHIMP